MRTPHVVYSALEDDIDDLEREQRQLYSSLTTPVLADTVGDDDCSAEQSSESCIPWLLCAYCQVGSADASTYAPKCITIIYSFPFASHAVQTFAEYQVLSTQSQQRCHLFPSAVRDSSTHHSSSDPFQLATHLVRAPPAACSVHTLCALTISVGPPSRSNHIERYALGRGVVRQCPLTCHWSPSRTRA